MAWESFEKERTKQREKIVQKFLTELMTSGSGGKATRLVLWNDNAQKYSDLGGYSKDVLVDKFCKFYDIAFANGEASQK